MIKDNKVEEVVIPIRHCNCGRTIKTNLRYCSFCGRYFQGIICNDSKTGKEIIIPETAHERHCNGAIDFEFGDSFGVYLSSFTLPCKIDIHFFSTDSINNLLVLTPVPSDRIPHYLPSVATIQRESIVIAEEIQKSGNYDNIIYRSFKY